MSWKRKTNRFRTVLLRSTCDAVLNNLLEGPRCICAISHQQAAEEEGTPSRSSFRFGFRFCWLSLLLCRWTPWSFLMSMHVTLSIDLSATATCFKWQQLLHRQQRLVRRDESDVTWKLQKPSKIGLFNFVSFASLEDVAEHIMNLKPVSAHPFDSN